MASGIQLYPLNFKHLPKLSVLAPVLFPGSSEITGSILQPTYKFPLILGYFFYLSLETINSFKTQMLFFLRGG